MSCIRRRLLIIVSCDSSSIPTSGDPYYVDCLIGKYKNYLLLSMCCQDDLRRRGGSLAMGSVIILNYPLDPQVKAKWLILWASASTASGKVLVSRKTNTLRKTRLIAR